MLAGNYNPSAMENENEKIVQLLLLLLSFYGIYPFTENISLFRRNWLLVYSYVTYACMVAGNLCLVIFSKDVISAINGLSVIIGSVYFFLVQFLSAYKLQNLRKLIVAFRSHDVRWRTFVKELKIEKKISQDRMFCVHKCIAAYNIVSYTMVVVFPIFSVWFLNMSNMGAPSSLLFTCWYPWNVRDIRWYLFTYFVQVFNGVLFQLILYTTTTFNVIVLWLFKNDFHELKITIRNLRYSQNSLNFIYDLKFCVKRHQTLTSSFNEYRSWFNVLYASELAYYTIEFLFLGSMAFTKSEDIIYQARSCLLLLNITGFLYVHCWIGESFYCLNNSLCEALYSLPWYEENFGAAKRDICLFVNQTQYPLCLTAFKTFQASLQVFFGILRSSYGYLSLLLALLK